MLKHLGALLLLACLFMMPWQVARSQDADEEVVDSLVEEFEDFQLGEEFQLFSILGTASGLSGASINLDGDDGDSDLEIRSFKLPVRREWKEGRFCLVTPDDRSQSDYELQALAKVQSENALCASPYTELTLSYLRADQRVEVSEDLGLDVDVTTLSALAGFGLAFQITERTSLRPIFLAGYSHIDNGNAFNGGLADVVNDTLDGGFVNGDIDSFLFGAAAELRHERTLQNAVELRADLRYSHLVSSVFNATDDGFEGTNDFVVIRGKVEASIPTGFELFSREVRALGFAGTNLLLESLSEKFSEDDFIHEIGGGLELENPALVEGIRLRGSVLFGDGITGWRAGLAIKF